MEVADTTKSLKSQKKTLLVCCAYDFDLKILILNQLFFTKMVRGLFYLELMSCACKTIC